MSTIGVRAHARRGTRGVRRHLRYTVRLATPGEMRTFNDPRNKRAVLFLDDPDTTLLFYPDDVTDVENLSRLLEHEQLHQALIHADEHIATVAMDTRRTRYGLPAESIEPGGLYIYEPRDTPT